MRISSSSTKKEVFFHWQKQILYIMSVKEGLVGLRDHPELANFSNRASHFFIDFTSPAPCYYKSCPCSKIFHKHLSGQKVGLSRYNGGWKK